MSILVYIIAGLGAGIATGFTGLSAAVIIAPMLIAFVGFDPYLAIGVALASDVLASLLSAFIYSRNHHIDIKGGLLLGATTVIFTFIGSYLGTIVSPSFLGNLSVYFTVILGIRFIVKPIVRTENRIDTKSSTRKIIYTLISGIPIGLICGFAGAGGGMMLLFVLTVVLGYELKTAVGTSVMVMTFSAFTGAVSHFYIGGMPDLMALIICMVTALLGAFIASRIANKVNVIMVNRLTGIVLTVLGIFMIFFKY